MVLKVQVERYFAASIHLTTVEFIQRFLPNVRLCGLQCYSVGGAGEQAAGTVLLLCLAFSSPHYANFPRKFRKLS